MKKQLPIVPRPERQRRIPRHFSWVDHRLVRDGHLQACRTPALALYLFLLTVADKDGISYYKDRTVCGMLRWDFGQLHAAREELLKNGLIAYEPPFYQVLDLDPQPPDPAPPKPSKPAHKVQPPMAGTPDEISLIVAQWKAKHGYTDGGNR